MHRLIARGRKTRNTCACLIVGRLMPKSEEIRTMFAWGAIGGALPTLGKIAGTYGANFDAPMPHISGVLAALALYGIIGSVVARAVGNPDLKQALFAGIAAPAIVVSVIAGVGDSKSQQTKSQGAANRFFSSAFAQGLPAPTSGVSRSISINVDLSSSYPVVGTIQIFSKGAENSTPVGAVTLNGAPLQTTVQVPRDTTTLVFKAESGANAQVNVTDQAAVSVNVVPKTSALQDFKWALGSQRALDIGALDARPADPPNGWVAVGYVNSDWNFSLAGGHNNPAALTTGTTIRAKTSVNVRPSAANWSTATAVLGAGQCFTLDGGPTTLKAGNLDQIWAKGHLAVCPVDH
jgi:hypothetical protein